MPSRRKFRRRRVLKGFGSSDDVVVGPDELVLHAQVAAELATDSTKPNGIQNGRVFSGVKFVLVGIGESDAR